MKTIDLNFVNPVVKKVNGKTPRKSDKFEVELLAKAPVDIKTVPLPPIVREKMNQWRNEQGIMGFGYDSTTGALLVALAYNKNDKDDDSNNPGPDREPIIKTKKPIILLPR